MFQYLFFCCQENQKENTNTVLLDNIINNKEENVENINYTTQANNNQNDIEEPYKNNNNNNNNEKEKENKQFFENGVILNNKNFFINENNIFNNKNSSTQILTINNINNININFQQRKSFSKEPIKLLENIKSKDSSKNIQKTIVSGENSRDQFQNKSFISFSNLTIKYNNNNNIGGSSINFSDTEIMSSCELTLIGDIFFYKEIKIDRSGIKNPLITSTNRYNKIKKKACELKFGVVNNLNKLSSSSLISKNNDEKNINKNSSQNLNNKNNKLVSMKGNPKKKIQNLSSLSSLNNSLINKNIIDVLLNLQFSKIQKKINKNSNINNNIDNIILFILKYDTSLDMFQLISTQDNIPIELLLDYNYPLRFQQNYNLLVGSIKMKLKIIKNENNESILNIAVLFDEENAEGKEKKNEIIYRFNPFIDKMPVTIGRINCDINLNNISVSKLHAQIDYIYDYDEYFIIDCKSTNGTYLLLKSPLNSIYVKRELHLKLFESKFKIQYVNFDN